jgi:hypothetical protein
MIHVTMYNLKPTVWGHGEMVSTVTLTSPCQFKRLFNGVIIVWRASAATDRAGAVSSEHGDGFRDTSLKQKRDRSGLRCLTGHMLITVTISEPAPTQASRARN